MARRPGGFLNRTKPAGLADRRRFRRASFVPPLEGDLSGISARVLNLSAAGVLVEHDGPLPARLPLRLSFDWYELIEVDVRPLRTGQDEGRLRSALEIGIPSGALVRSLALHLATATIARLESLVEASKLINSAIEPDVLIEAILSVARAELGVECGTVYFLDHRRQEIWTEVAGPGGPVMVRSAIGRGVAGHVARTAESLILDDAFADARFDPAVDLVSAFPSASMLCVPVRDRDQAVVGVLQFLHDQHRSFLGGDLEFLEAISGHVAIAMRNAAFVLEGIEKNRMEADLRLAREIQVRLLPQAPDNWSGIAVAVSSVPCFEVGGDYHDFLDLPRGEVGLAVGDVSGKGMAAALIMSSTQAALRIAAPDEEDLARLISRLDVLLHRTTANAKFATFFFGRYSPESGVLRYVNAGHSPPLLCGPTGIVRLETTGPPLGIMTDARYEELAVQLEIGSTLVLYTDGFSEAANPDGEEFGTKRWEALVRERVHSPVVELSRVLTDEITRFENGAHPADDKTLIVFRRTA